MANYIQVSAQSTEIVDGVRTTLPQNSSITFFTTSSNQIASTVAVNSNAYTALSLGSCADVIHLAVYNDNSVWSASIIQLSGSTAQGPIGTMIFPGVEVPLWNSGSITTLSAKVVGGYPYGTSTPVTGSIQYFAVQS